MNKATRISLLLSVALLGTSCSEAGDTLSPGVSPQAGAFSSGALASVKGADSEDQMPENMDAIASYSSSPNTDANGAQKSFAMIGPLGGSLRHGDFEIVVPAGAVSAMTKFSIMTFPENNTRKHALASFSPHRTFSAPITLRVPLSATESAGATDVSVLWWNGSAWVAQRTTATSDGRLETQTTHFSLYGTQRRGFTLAGG